MNSYIVRIYQREPTGDPAVRAGEGPLLAGTVEDPDSGARTGFRGMQELWAILGGATPPGRPGPDKADSR
jgi:hypothetical protein